MAGQDSDGVLRTHNEAEQGPKTQGGGRADHMESLDTGLKTAVETRRSPDAANRSAKTRIEKLPSRSTSFQRTLNPVPAMTWSKRRLHSVAVDGPGSARKCPARPRWHRQPKVAVSISAACRPPSRCAATRRAFRRQMLGNDQGAYRLLGRQCTVCPVHWSGTRRLLGPDAKPDRGERIRRQSERWRGRAVIQLISSSRTISVGFAPASRSSCGGCFKAARLPAADDGNRLTREASKVSDIDRVGAQGRGQAPQKGWGR